MQLLPHIHIATQQLPIQLAIYGHIICSHAHMQLWLIASQLLAIIINCMLGRHTQLYSQLYSYSQLQLDKCAIMGIAIASSIYTAIWLLYHIWQNMVLLVYHICPFAYSGQMTRYIYIACMHTSLYVSCTIVHKISFLACSLLASKLYTAERYVKY